ncbi:ABC transporter permease [Deinococcus koreensis]|uniref:ABC transporter permease n=1 Tax=Deinococcus koreensis TaxID=2054903 RepID=A0A2K3UW03_9DEIO|nr:ABC transporter permease [Deinococcus koreensis]PNY80711.1 ABC transporter permease [Deinococcus koreensis]
MTQPSTAPPAKRSFHLPNFSTLGPLIALLVACIFFATQSDRFLTLNTFSLILQQASFVGVIAIGQTLIILTAGIDLSCGMIMALSSMVIGKLAVEQGLPVGLAILAGFAVGAFVGWLNGLLITRWKLPPFIVTLGMYSIVFAAVRIYSRATSVPMPPDGLTFLAQRFELFGTRFSYGSLLMLLLFLLTWLYLNYTAPGRHIYALGNNPEAVRLSGINNNRLLLSVYTFAGLLYGVAALLLLERIGGASPEAGQTENLESITAVVIGGTSLFGGRGNVLGTLIGALIVGVFRSGLTLMGLDSVYQNLITGILIILAVATDQFSRRRS